MQPKSLNFLVAGDGNDDPEQQLWAENLGDGAAQLHTSSCIPVQTKLLELPHRDLTRIKFGWHSSEPAAQPRTTPAK